MFDIRDGLPPGLDEERHKSGDVGRRDLVAAALQHVYGVQRERFLVAPVSHPQVGEPGRRVLRPVIPNSRVLFPTEGVQVLMGQLEGLRRERLDRTR